MRKLALFFALAIASCTFAQVKVTYTTPAVPIKRAVAELAAKSGLNLQTVASVENEVVILRVEDAPIDEVMKQIANVTSGEWTKQGDIYYLGASRAARGKEEQDMRALFVQKLNTALKKMQESLTKKPAQPKPEEEPGEMDIAMGFGMGGSISMTKLAVALGASNLAAAPGQGRVVFANNPTRMQRPLPASANAAIAEFIAEHNKMAAASRNEEPAKDQVPEEAREFMNFFGMNKKPKVITGNPAKALVILTREGLFGLTLQLKLYDANGKSLATGMLPLNIDSPFDVEEFAKANSEEPKPEPEDKTAEIKLSPISLELRNMGSSMMRMNGGNLKLSDDLQKRLQNPADHDPLSFVHSEALIQISQNRKLQLVANLPDSVLSFFGSFRNKPKLTEKAFLDEIVGDDEAKVEEKDGWLVVKPMDPMESRSQRTNRPSLQKLIEEVTSKGYASLDDLASYALVNPAPFTDAPASTMYIMMYAPGALQQGMMGESNWEMIRFYGLLSGTQRQTLRQSGRIPFGQLTPPQQAQLTKMLFSSDGDLQVDQPDKQPKADQDPFTAMIQKQMSRFGGGAEGDFRTEPTEIMPNGLPAQGVVTLSFSSEPVGVPVEASTNMGMFSALGSMELGIFKMMKEDPQMQQMAGNAMPTIGSLRVGTRSNYEFKFYVAADVFAEQTLQDNQVGKNAKVYKTNELPSDFQGRIDKFAESFKNNPLFKMMGRMGGMGGGRMAPPPSP